MCGHTLYVHTHSSSEIQPLENVILGDVDFKLGLECFD